MMVGGDYPGQSQLDISSEETAPTYVDTYGFPDSTFVELDQQLRALFPPDTYFPSHLIAFNVVSDAENPSLYRVDKNIRFLAARDALPRQLRKCAFIVGSADLLLWWCEPKNVPAEATTTLQGSDEPTEVGQQGEAPSSSTDGREDPKTIPF